MNAPAPNPEAVDLLDLIDRLAEPVEPAPISLAPQAMGWTVLAVLLSIALAWWAWRAIARWRRNAYRRAALRELAAAGDDAAAIALVLRRTALAVWPRQRVASLSGSTWLEFLDATGGRNQFVDGPGAVLATAPYFAATAGPQLQALAARWIRRHRVEEPP